MEQMKRRRARREGKTEKRGREEERVNGVNGVDELEAGNTNTTLNNSPDSDFFKSSLHSHHHSLTLP